MSCEIDLAIRIFRIDSRNREEFVKLGRREPIVMIRFTQNVLKSSDIDTA